MGRLRMNELTEQRREEHKLKELRGSSLEREQLKQRCDLEQSNEL